MSDFSRNSLERMSVPVALLRPPTETFGACVTDEPPDPPLDPAVAASQHDAYRRALEDGGFATRMLASPSGHPDAPFVEDTAVVVGDRAVITRPGHPSRRGEVDGVAGAVDGLVRSIARIAPPARIDGGDVLQVGHTVFVGRSSRTDDAGIAALRSAVPDRRIVPVDVDGVLHLKSAVTAPDARTVLVAPGAVDEAPFAPLRIVHCSDDPNVVRLPDGRVLVAAAGTAGLLGRLGHVPVLVDIGEFARAGGGLTCLSVRIRDVYATGTP